MTDGVMSLNDMLNFTPKQDEAFKSMFKNTFTYLGAPGEEGKPILALGYDCLAHVSG